MDIALYARVSTNEQTTEQQLHQLREWAGKAGHTVVDEFTDVASGAKVARPGLRDLQGLVTARRVQLVAVVALDRLGRSLQDLVTLLADWQAQGCGLYSAREGLDATTAAGRALLGMAAVFAEFERSLIVERTKAGIDRARRQGKHIGRPSIPAAVRRRAEALLKSGASQRSVRKALGLGGGTISSIAKELT
ncbi:MAG: recombinase family protein [Woeseia sp.]